jgi:4-hydroxy-2-oxoglutarate aldolase
MVAAQPVLAGLMPPLPTPFRVDGEIDLAALGRNLERWNAHALAGYVVLGSNGEAPLLDDDERVRLVKAVRAAVPADRRVVVGAGAESTRRAIALSRAAAAAGADAVLVVTPCYYGGAMTPDRLVRHFHDVADASPVPVVAYNVPRNTHVDMDAATVARIAEHRNVIGVKDSGGNVAKLADMVRRCPADFSVLTGAGGVLLPALTMGAAGAIVALALVATRECLELADLAARGEIARAAELQRRLVPVNEAVTVRYGVAGVKAALDMLGFEGGPVRAPLGDLQAEGRAALRATLVEANLLC